MEIPANVEVKETRTSYYWFDSDGILCSVSKKDPPDLSPEESRLQVEDFIDLFGDKKRCILIDARYAKPNSPEERKRAAESLNKLTKAMAVIVHNPMGRMIVNLFIGLQKPSYPMKIFKPGEEDKAKEWLLNHMDDG